MNRELKNLVASVTTKGETTELVFKNPCQLWQKAKQIFNEDHGAHIVVKTAAGKLFKDLSCIERKNGKWQMTNSAKDIESDVDEAVEAVSRIEAEMKKHKEEHKGGCIFITA